MATRTRRRSGPACPSRLVHRVAGRLAVHLFAVLAGVAAVVPVGVVAVATAPTAVATSLPAVTLTSCLARLRVGRSGGSSGRAGAVAVQVHGSVQAGRTADVVALYSCDGPGGPVPIVGLRVRVTTDPAGTLSWSQARPVTNAAGTVSDTGRADATGRVTVELHGRGLCRVALAHRVCRVRIVLGTLRRAVPVRPRRRYLGIVPPSNPLRNAPALGAIPASCATAPPVAPGPGEPAAAFGSAPGCTAYYLRAIDAARAAEGVAPIELPTDWARLTAAEQLFVVADLERVDRGLPPYVGLSASLDAVAQQGANAGADPALGAVPADSAASTWAGGMAAVLAADYQWVYDDGYGSANSSCGAPGAPGCWGHRDGILGVVTGVGCTDCVMGAGAALGGRWRTSLTEIFVAPVRPGAIPTFFTWQRDVLPYLRAVPSG